MDVIYTDLAKALIKSLIKDWSANYPVMG